MRNEITFSSLLKSIAAFSVSSWVNFLIGIISVIITTRLFSPEIFGLLNIFNNASGVIVGISTIGLSGAFLRFFNEPPLGWDKHSLFAKCLSLSILFLMAITAISLLFWYSEISSRLFNKVSFFFTVLLSVNALSTMVLSHYYLQFYRLENDVYHYTVQSIVINFFSKLFVVLAAFVSPTDKMVLTFNTMGLFIVMLVYSFIQRKSVFPKKYPWSNKNFGEVLKFALYSWPLAFVVPVSAFLIPFIIKTKLDMFALGIFSSVGFFVAAFNVIQGGFRTYWAAFMYSHYKTEQQKIIKVHNYIVIFIIAILGMFIIFQHIVYMLIGSQFHSSRYFFSLLLIDPLLLLLEQTTSYGMSIAKKNQESTAIYIFSVLVHALCTFFLIERFGLLGAAIGSAVAGLMRFALATWRGQVYYKSLDNIIVTASGVLLLVFLGISNCVLFNHYFFEVLFVLFTFAITVFIFKREFLGMYRYLKVNILR